MANRKIPGDLRALQGDLLSQLIDCEIERRLLEMRAKALREQLGLSPTPEKPAKPGRTPGTRMSAEGRARIAAAQRARWAREKRERQKARSTAQAAALKKRWDAYRAGTGPRPGDKGNSKPAIKLERKKVEWTPAMRKAAAERMRRVNKEMAKRRADAA